MALRAVGKKIIIRQNQAETTTASGLVIPEAAQEKPQEGTVYAISAEATQESDLHAGDTVVYSRYGGTHITDDGVEYVICEAKDILAVVVDA